MKTATFVFCIFSFCIILPLGASPRDSGEHIVFSLGHEWKVVQNAQTRTYTILEFVREGDTIDTWNELVTVQNFNKSHAYRSSAETLDELKATREKECPGVTQWSVIDKGTDSILYEWHAKGCLGQSEQHELARILYGKHNVFFLHYAAKVHELKPDTRAEWIKKFAAVSIDSGSSPSDLNGEGGDVDGVVPFAVDKVMAALRSAMESAGCKVTETNADRIECKRSREYSQEVSGTGGEKVTGALEGKGDQTRVRISTGKGFYGRLGKKNWSSPIYKEMLKRLQAPPP